MIVGLTGPVGVGKSTVSRELVRLGINVIDIDAFAADVVREKGISPAEALRRVLNGDAALVAEVMPVVKARLTSSLESSPRPVVIDAPLLFEHGLDAWCTTTVCLTAPASVRRERVMARKTASSTLFDQIEATQWPAEKKEAAAAHVVSTDQVLSETIAALQRAIQW